MDREVLLTEAIIKQMVKDPETVSVKEFETDDEEIRQIEVLVSSDDISKIIGREGKVINAIRTIVQASASINDGKKVKINVDSY